MTYKHCRPRFEKYPDCKKEKLTFESLTWEGSHKDSVSNTTKSKNPLSRERSGIERTCPRPRLQEPDSEICDSIRICVNEWPYTTSVPAAHRPATVCEIPPGVCPGHIPTPAVPLTRIARKRGGQKQTNKHRPTSCARCSLPPTIS